METSKCIDSSFTVSSPTTEHFSTNTQDHSRETEKELPDDKEGNVSSQNFETGVLESSSIKSSLSSALDHRTRSKEELKGELEFQNLSNDGPNSHYGKGDDELDDQILDTVDLLSANSEDKNAVEIPSEKDPVEPVFDGMEEPEVEETKISSNHSLNLGSEQGSVWPDKAIMLKNLVKVKGAVVVSNVIHRLSGKKDENEQKDEDEQKPCSDKISNDSTVAVAGVEESAGIEPSDVNQKTSAQSVWNPLSYVRTVMFPDKHSISEQGNDMGLEGSSNLKPAMKGRIIIYTRLGCKDCKETRLFLRHKALKFIEINIDIYPRRNLELENKTGSSVVPKVFFNDLLVGGLSELNDMAACGRLDEKINALINEVPSTSAPFPPLSGEDDESGNGVIDESAIIVRKMRESIVVRDRFYKLRRFTCCFIGSDAVNFLSEDEYLEREHAIELGRNLASKHFFRHVLDENLFEDGNHPYRFLDDDPVVRAHCYNIPRGIIDVKPKAIVEIASRLRLLSLAMFEAYAFEDGTSVDYQSICLSEEFARYLRTVEELQRVDLNDLSREEKLAFFINLYNMMAIHGILTLGYPVGALERRRLYGDFKYVIGGHIYSLSAIQNGILRGNRRPPYNLMKPFGARDQRLKVSLPCPEPLIHFGLVCGTRSGPALRCYSPGNIDKELVDAAKIFLRSGGIVVDTVTKVASLSSIFKWYSMDFGNNETEVIKHAANYLELDKSVELLTLLAESQLKVVYQPFDWSLNCWE